MRTLHKRSRSSRKPSGVGFTFLQVEGTEVANVGPAGCTDDTTGYFRNERPDSEDEIDEDKWMHNESCDQTNLKAWDYASRFRTHFGTMHWETAWITVGISTPCVRADPAASMALADISTKGDPMMTLGDNPDTGALRTTTMWSQPGVALNT